MDVYVYVRCVRESKQLLVPWWCSEGDGAKSEKGGVACMDLENLEAWGNTEGDDQVEDTGVDGVDDHDSGDHDIKGGKGDGNGAVLLMYLSQRRGKSLAR